MIDEKKIEKLRKQCILELSDKTFEDVFNTLEKLWKVASLSKKLHDKSLPCSGDCEIGEALAALEDKCTDSTKK